MNFLEANRILKDFSGGVAADFLLAMSGNGDNLLLYIKAYGAKSGLDAKPQQLDFGTLGQYLASNQTDSPTQEIFLLFPWDFAPACDWRTGVAVEPPSFKELLQQVEIFAQQLQNRGVKGLYIPAPIPPLYYDNDQQKQLSSQLTATAVALGLKLLNPHCFSLDSYLATGTPIGAAHLPHAAEEITVFLQKKSITAVSRITGGGKALITDLDNTLYYGVIGEDGLNGIQYGPQGVGYKHFIYQTVLKRLKNEGVLLIVVSKNDSDLARLPLTDGDMVLKQSDFIHISASYEAKSAQISSISQQLNLGLDSFMFVDDNPVELAEVSLALPQITCGKFPVSNKESFSELLEQINQFFHRKTVSQEDKSRTELYQKRLLGLAPSQVGGADLTTFLQQLDMELIIHDRTKKGGERGIQLINKTNQFNLNGRRFKDDEVDAIISQGGRLLTATLYDKSGSHGEILSCLLTVDGVVESFVISCRVLQRYVEHAFICWLCQQSFNLSSFSFKKSDRNKPLQKFIASEGFVKDSDGAVKVDGTSFLQLHQEKLGIFKLRF
ncbi:MAG: HAD-IIIC family phosphatase [Magnetococcales bacterium]|nr:HAD-IIIC family phosphatase [Magnetococcales bacterium]